MQDEKPVFRFIFKCILEVHGIKLVQMHRELDLFAQLFPDNIFVKTFGVKTENAEETLDGISCEIN